LTSHTLTRPSQDCDIAALTGIHGFHVRHGSGTFEIEAPSEAETARRRADVTGKGLPWRVAEIAGVVQGYAYADHFRPRPACRFCLEDLIHLAPSAARWLDVVVMQRPLGLGSHIAPQPPRSSDMAPS
jgi:L-amino acid N-acyltransferase YncA